MPIDEKLTQVFVSIRSGLARAVGGIVPPKEIEDIVQETYVRVAQTKGIVEIRSPRSFMYKTARNIALNYVNKAEVRLSESFDEVGSTGWATLLGSNTDVVDDVCTDEEFSHFCDAVRDLPVKCRRAFVLKKVYGHSYREIAETLNISEKTVEKHISNGIMRCRSYMKRRAEEGPSSGKTIVRTGGRP